MVLTWAEAGCKVRAASVEAFNQFTTPMDFLIICRPANDTWLIFCYAPRQEGASSLATRTELTCNFFVASLVAQIV